jgi:hypothetical protein
MARKVHVCIKNWEFYLVTPPKCQKLPSSIPKTAHVKFRAIALFLDYHSGCAVSAGLVVFWVLLQLNFQFVPKKKEKKEEVPGNFMFIVNHFVVII